MSKRYMVRVDDAERATVGIIVGGGLLGRAVDTYDVVVTKADVLAFCGRVFDANYEHQRATGGPCVAVIVSEDSLATVLAGVALFRGDPGAPIQMNPTTKRYVVVGHEVLFADDNDMAPVAVHNGGLK